jgi:EAL domain-containing protein (putative c-di-GMP-specific phosphodiesterase class I)/GGDEF domain-containing protein
MGSSKDNEMSKALLLLFEWTDRHQRPIHLYAAPILFLLVLAVYALVYQTGGIKFVYSHSMYIVILLSGFILGIRGGIIFGLIAGAVLGPFMPIDVITGEMQKTFNWLYRMGMFTLIGFLSGAASDGARFYQEKLKWLYQHNISTRLRNRSALLDRIKHITSHNKHSLHTYLLVVISCENEKELKSAFGFAIVEEAVQQLSKRYANNQIDADIYHTDTAQLAILLDMGTRDIDKLLHVLTDASREPILYNQVLIHIDTRMGYVTFDHDEEMAETYLHMAEAALTVAHETARDAVAYSASIMTATEDNLSLLGELKDAIKNGQLSFHYQPKVDIPTGIVYGAEALMRWNHPTRGNIPPYEFIPRAEQSTLIDLITEFALEEAINQIAEWKKIGINISISVNISTHNLLQPHFTDFILGLLNQYGVSGDLLELEITEGALMMEVERTIDELRRLANQKIIISIDDFGTGYSSLQYLHQLPISLIKIDQSFVRRLPADKGATYILDAAVMLAHNMGIKSIAEGVENKEVYDFLNNIGCDMAQGYMISRPMPAQDFEKWYLACNGKFVAT